MATPILFFGDGSLPLHPAYSQLLQARKDDSLLSIFLDRSRRALQLEISRIPKPDRKGMPTLSELESLVPMANDSTPDHQCLAPAMAIIIQLGQFISWYEERPDELYPRRNSTIIIGLCIGQLSATAVSLAQSLTELIPLAVESVRLAFRIGLLATTVRDELETQVNPEDAWAMAVSKDVDLGLLTTIHDATGITKRKQAYFSAIFRKTGTLQGPPSTLGAIDNWLAKNPSPSKSFRQRLPIYTPYHAPHLYTNKDLSQLLDSPDQLRSISHETGWIGPQLRLLSPITGKYYSVRSRRELLENILQNILREPIQWVDLVHGCVEAVAASNLASWIVRPFGPTLVAGSLASALKIEAKVDVNIDPVFSSSNPSQLATATKEPIAIVGMAGRFPEAMSHDQLWDILEKGVDCHKVIPIDRFDAEIYGKNGDARNPIGTPYGCFMEKPGLFDARFFNMSPREAEQTDPQQRLILTTAYEALEMSGFVQNRTPSTQLDRVGTYYGQTTDDYRENACQDVQTYFVSGTDRAFGPGRINHHFKFGGPSMSIDTACSSSAVALNVACTALWVNDCDMALAGGMSLFTNPDVFCGLSRGHFLNNTGNCKTFDDAADGYCRGEAAATVVLKRLSDAQADNDNILAVVLAAGTNYSAASASITHPHGPTQEVLYRRLLNEAGLHPFDIDYVELHGTGTQAGDAAEMSSVSNVFAPAFPSRPADQSLLLGSVKANLGHGESASGITALIKTLLVFREEKVPPHIGIKSGVMNHTFPDLKQRNIKVALNGVESFPRQKQRKRRALLNNFGAAGGNTALILEESPEKNTGYIMDSRKMHLISVTAKSSASMHKNIQNLVTYLTQRPTTSLSDLSYTTTARRMQFPIRISVIASSIPELKGHLSSALTNQSFKSPTKVSNIIFTFTGQGSLYLPLANDLFRSSQQFRADLIRFNQICRDLGFPDFISIVDGSASDINALEPAQTQLAITAVQMSLSRLWKSWSIVPTAVIGHSLGEYAALFASGVLSANDTLYIVGRRAKYLQEKCTQKTHQMLSVRATMVVIEKAIGKSLDALEVACINGPEDIVLSGPMAAVDEAKRHLDAVNIRNTVLSTPYAFHSAQIDPILRDFETAAESLEFLKPRIPILSPLLGTTIRDIGVVTPSYLALHARKGVNFEAALKQADSEGLGGQNSVWLEIGPSPICVGMVKATLGSNVSTTCSLRKNENPWTSITKALSFFHNKGVYIDWNEYHRDFEGGQNLLHIPTYSFDEKNHWIPYSGPALGENGHRSQGDINTEVHSSLTTTVQRLVSKEINGTKLSLVFETDLSEPNLHGIIAGHTMNGLALCPAGVYADMAATVADYIRREFQMKIPTTGINVTGMEILGPIIVPVPRQNLPQYLHITCAANLITGGVDVAFGTYPSQNAKTGSNARCRIEYGDQKHWLDDWSSNSYLVQKRIEDLQRGIQGGSTNKILKKMAYQMFSSVVIYGPKYQGMDEILVNNEELEATASLCLYQGTDVGNFFASPLWIDNLAQLSGFIMNAIGIVDPRVEVFIAHGWESLQIALPMDTKKPYRVHVKMHPSHSSTFVGTVSIFQGDSMVGLLRGIKFQKVPRPLLDTMLTLPKTTATINSRTINTTASLQGSVKFPSAPSSKLALVPKLVLVQSSPVDKVLEIIAEEIGIPIVDLADDSNFSDLGVDSLLSLTILSKVRESIQMDLPPSTFEASVTVGDLRRCLSSSPASNSGDDDSDISRTATIDSGYNSQINDSESNDTADKLIDTLHNLIARQIGVEVEDLLAADDDLSTLGVDSLLSLSIIADIREHLGLDVPSNALEGSFSLRRIKEALGITSTPSPKFLVSESKSKPEGKNYVANSLLLQGSPNTASKIIFLFPDGSGSATSYAALPKIAPNTCVFAINSPFLKFPAEFNCSLEEVSLMMLDEVLLRQPKGPYYLAGWSAGGMYAYEAAKNLISSGEIVEKLILIDSPCRLDYGPMPKDILDFVSTRGVISGSSGGAAPQWLVDHFEGTIKAIRDYAPTPFEPLKSPSTDIIWASKGVFEDWPQAELAGLDLSHSIASWMLKPKADPNALGWDKLIAPSNICHISVDGNHFNMVHPPNCNSLSQAIADSMEVKYKRRLSKWKYI